MNELKKKKKHYRSKRSVACDISSEVRKIVKDRDKACIFCGSAQDLEIAHYISRGSGGLGIPENLTLACHKCHVELDQGVKGKYYKAYQKAYLYELYPGFNDRRYKK